MASVLILYAEPLGYTIALAEEFANMGHQVEMVYWDTKKLAPFKPFSDKVRLTPRSTVNRRQLTEMVARSAPDLLLVSGWMDGGYLSASFSLRKASTARVVLFDDQWIGTARQRLGSFAARAGALRPFFTHAAASGPRQFEYARRFGFDIKQICLNWLSSDTNKFHTNFSVTDNNGGRSGRVLFVGRFSEEKGIHVLARGWEEFVADFPDWKLDAVGAGPLEAALRGTKNVVVHPYKTAEGIRRLAETVDFAVVPSLRDQWGVVVHEFTSLGLPLVASAAVGSADELLIPGFNGFKFETGDTHGLGVALRRMARLSDREMVSFSQNSALLAGKFSPTIGAHALLATLPESSNGQ